MAKDSLPTVVPPQEPVVDGSEYVGQREVFTTVAVDGKVVEYSVERTSGDVPTILLKWGQNRKGSTMGLTPAKELDWDLVQDMGQSVGIVLKNGVVTKYVVPALVDATKDKDGKWSASRKDGCCTTCGVMGDHVPDCPAVRKSTTTGAMSKAQMQAKARK